MSHKTPKDYGLSIGSLEMDYWGPYNVEKELPFKLKAKDFLNFAELDLKGDSKRDIINALSNIKRAIENRMDCLLFIFGYSKISKNFNFPDKLNKLNKLNIVAPRILAKINKIRNLLEHEYKIPKKSQVEDALDVAILFLESTKNFLKKFVKDFACYSKKHSIWVKFNKKYDGIEIGISRKGISNKEDRLIIDAKDPSFDEWIKFIVNLVY